MITLHIKDAKCVRILPYQSDNPDVIIDDVKELKIHYESPVKREIPQTNVSRGRTLVIGEIPNRATLADVSYEFKKYGRCYVVLKNGGVGYVRYDDYRDAIDALELDGSKIKGSRISVKREYTEVRGFEKSKYNKEKRFEKSNGGCQRKAGQVCVALDRELPIPRKKEKHIPDPRLRARLDDELNDILRGRMNRFGIYDQKDMRIDRVDRFNTYDGKEHRFSQNRNQSISCPCHSCDSSASE